MTQGSFVVGTFLLLTIGDNRLGVPGGGLQVAAGAGGGSEYERWGV